jgi:N-acetyl sugar amidotransferase
MMPQNCRRCLYVETHPLGLTFDEEGLCSGCRIHEEKNGLDWSERWRMLEKIVAPYRSQTGNAYDCIVPVSGAHDSYWIMHLVKERLGLNPLLVTYNKQFNTALGIKNLANLRIRFDCDILIQNVDPRIIKRVTRTTLRMFGSMYWHCLAGQTVFPVQTAVRYKTPLIIWGAHQGLEQVGMFSHTHEVEMTRRYRKDHDLMGHEGGNLLSIFDVLSEDDLRQFRYPDDADLEAVGVRGIYLGNYVRWDPKTQHEQMISMHGYRTSSFARTFDCYDYVDCCNYMDVHDLLKLYKHGYSKVTDHASREIRHGRLTRDEALLLVRRHEQEEPQYLDHFCDWLGIDRRGLQFLMDHHRNPRVWRQTGPGKWAFYGWSTLHDGTGGGEPNIAFTQTDRLECDAREGYIIVGKGYPT